ncbi:MAG: UDP-N-acetylmuramate--L-alanine ligase, partial [Clostridia bacterium]
VATLRKKGIPVAIGHAAENIMGADLIIYTVAIAADNPERLAAQAQGIPQMERAVLLGQLMEGYDRAIGVCGAHGKTTTSSMLAQVLLDTGMDPTVHIGGQYDGIGGSTRIGNTHTFLAEACEFNASFLHMHPTMAVVLNIDADHLDFYRDIEHIAETFAKFISLLPEDGVVVGYGDDARVRNLMAHAHCKTVSYGLEADNDWHTTDLTYDATGHGHFIATYHDQPMAKIELQVPGSFNVLNAMASLAAAHTLGADVSQAAQALCHFSGVHRRFEQTGEVEGVLFYHDYGHNPTEMHNALSVAKMQPHRKLWAVMQPHTYSRVKRLFADYIHCCDSADEILITDIYAAREKDPGDINANMLVQAIEKTGQSVHYTPNFADTEAYLRAHWQPGDLVLTMGCGNINVLND